MNLQETLINSASVALVMLAFHLLLCNTHKGGGFEKGLLIGAAGFAVYLALAFMDPAFNLLGLYLLVSFWLIYLMVFINVLNSVTLKMLAAIYQSPSSNLVTADFESIFNSTEGLETRIRMLTSSGMIIPDGASWSMSPKAKLIIMVVRGFKRFLGIA